MAMRVLERVLFVLAAAAVSASVAYALDGKVSSEPAPVGLGPALTVEPSTTSERTSIQAFREGTRFYLAGDKNEALKSLQYAANQGHTGAAWKLARMYAEGDGVHRDELKAYEYFRRIANQHADDAPGSPQAPFVASAFVELGNFFLRGIPGSAVERDPARAYEMFQYAASWFGDADAQYQLARMYLDGVGTERDARQAARWLSLAAQKGQYRAQAMLGGLLFKGDGVPRQPARGLMWLTLARDAAASADDAWIVDLYDGAFKTATQEERTLALGHLQQWLKTYR